LGRGLVFGFGRCCPIERWAERKKLSSFLIFSLGAGCDAEESGGTARVERVCGSGDKLRGLVSMGLMGGGAKAAGFGGRFISRGFSSGFGLRCGGVRFKGNGEVF